MASTQSEGGNPGAASEEPSGSRSSATPAFHRPSGGDAAVFPTPAMDDPGKIHQPQQSPCYEQTPAPNQTPHAMYAAPDPWARGSSSFPYPMNDLASSSRQLLQEREYKWCQRFFDMRRELEEKYFLQLEEREAKWYRRYDELYEQRSKKTKEIADKSFEIFTLIDTILSRKEEKMRSEDNFNLSGALELMVYHAKLTKKIRTDCPPRIQAGLNEIAKTPAFTKVLHDQVTSRGLALEAVTPSISSIYDKALEHSRGNDYIITLYKGDYTADEVAVLATFLKVQGEWASGLHWREYQGKRQANH